VKSAPAQSKLTFRRRLLRILLMSAALLFMLLVGLVHGASLVLSAHDRAMKPFNSRVVTNSAGHLLHWYELKQPEAEWNIVFIHGTPGTAAAFAEQFKHPFPHADLAALDRPGFGGSGPSRRVPGLEENADAVGLLLANLPKRKTILVGHSYGGPVALLAALKFPNQVAGVVLIGGSVDPAQERILLIQRIANWPVFSWLVPRPLRQCNRELLTLRGDLVKLQKKLPMLTVPVLMLHGTKDKLVPVANVEYLRAQLAAAGKSNLFDQLIFPEYNHFIPWQHPDAVEAALEKVMHSASHDAQNK
jgi:pimeloyl-ACP methyl ester carboxylesterase